MWCWRCLQRNHIADFANSRQLKINRKTILKVIMLRLAEFSSVPKDEP